MQVADAASRELVRSGVTRRLVRHSALLIGVSAGALLLAAPSASSRSLGGAATVSAPTIASDAAAQAAAQAAAAAAQGSASLNRATAAIQAMQAAQAAARAAAAGAGGVPNGLSIGGLVPDSGLAGQGVARPVLSWTNAKTPVQSGPADAPTVTVQQTGAQAILEWSSFNVGASTSLVFDQQGNSNWVALNRVVGAASPSRILGRIQADGQIYVINQNGIIFGGASQINVGSLIASTAAITNAQFKASGIYSAQSGGTYTPSFTGAGGRVIVEKGALIATSAPASVTSGGGAVILLGTEVDNAGSITTPKGQTVLAAGDDFILQRGFSTTVNTFSTVRGSEIAPVIHSSSLSGTVNNTGAVFSRQGDITLAGHRIVQDGILVSTTSVNQRGTIHLLNSRSDATGRVTLTGNAVSLILPELDNAELALNSQRDALIKASTAANLLRSASAPFDNLSLIADRQDQSRIEIVAGNLVDFQSGSLTMAKGGQIAVSAGTQVFAASGASIDVSGVVGVSLPMSANEIKVNIQGNELRDSPQNRDAGVLKNTTLSVDARKLVLVPAGTGGYASDRYYTPGGLLEVSGYLANVGHTIGEWSALGGTITLAAPQVVAQRGSIFNISGGSVDYAGGNIISSNLIGSDGRRYTADNAPAGLTFVLAQGFTVNHRRWGVTEIWSSPVGGANSSHYEQGYTVGRDAGNLTVSTPASVFEGSIVADVINGKRQTGARPAGVTDGYKLTQNTVAMAGGLTVATWLNTGTAILSRAVAADVAISATKPAGFAGLWFDSGALNADRLGGVSMAVKGAITLDAPLALADGGNLALYGGTVAVNGNITARGGSIALGQTTDSGLVQNTKVTVADGVILDTRGVWTNALADSNADLSRLAFINGGAVTVRSYGDVSLGQGSLIDASGGGALLNTGKFSGGNGGDITLVASYSVPGATGLLGSSNHGDLTLGGTLTSYGFGKGGKLTLETGGALVIGGTQAGQGATLSAGTAAPYELALTTPFTVPAGTALPIVATVSLTRLYSGAAVPNGAYANNKGAKVGGAGWTVPNGLYAYDANGNYIRSGTAIAAGTVLNQVSGQFPTGYSLPANSFDANGVSIFPVRETFVAGRVTPVDVTYPAGTVILKGLVLAQNAAVHPVLATSLAPKLFQSGFSAYSINGQSGLTVSDGVAITAQMSVLQLNTNAFGVASGAEISSVASLWTPPLYQEDPLKGVLIQRGGASIALLSGVGADGSGSSANQGSLTIGKGASVTVDPGQSIRLVSSGQVTVDGTITAHGGRIDVENNYGPQYSADPGSLSVWIGDDAVLDVSARANIAADNRRRNYGVVPDGGTINLGSTGGLLTINDSSGSSQPGTENSTNAYVIVRPGARLDASGTSGVLDVLNADGSTQKVTVASNGGAIALRSYSGIHAEGVMTAFAGGAGASGGTLTVSLESLSLTTTGTVPAALTVGRVLKVSQGVQNTLAANLLPGQGDTNLMLGQGSISVQQIAAGGFDSVSLLGRTAMVFDGNVSLNVGRSLSLKSGLYADLAAGTVALSAPYLRLAGQDQFTFGFVKLANVLPAYGDKGVFTVTGGLLDVAGNAISLFAATNLVSGGDLRFVNGGGVMAPSLYTAHNLGLSAARIYPASGVTATLQAGYTLAPYASNDGASLPSMVLTDTAAALTIGRPDASGAVAAPTSAFGSLNLVAGTIRQGGVLFAPFGSISLTATIDQYNQGITSTKSVVEFLPSSITSVSGKGLVMPYGGTSDGVTWSVDGAAPAVLNLITGQYLKSDGTLDASKPQVNGITVRASNIVGDRGAKLDLAGGGTLTGVGFVSGRGGSVDTLTTALANADPANSYSSAKNPVYAIVPGIVTAPVAGGSANAWTGATPSIGQQITIPAGVPGLPAGTYTLLPANYALLPGGYRVELGATGVNAAASGTQPLANGSYLTSGYQSVAGTSIRNSLPTGLIITSGATARTYSQYNETSYDAFQKARVAIFGQVRPLLEMDAKHLTLVFNALSASARGAGDPALSWNGVADLSVAPGGYGGALSILASSIGSNQYQNLIIAADGSTTQRSATQTVLSASIIDAFGAPNLFIGGAPALAEPGNTINQPVNVSVLLTDPFSRGNFVNTLTVESRAVLSGGQVLLSVRNAGNIRLNDGASIDTRGFADVKLLDSSVGDAFGGGSPLLVASNGDVTLYTNYAQFATGGISIGNGASIYTRGSIAFLSNSGVSFDGTLLLSAKNLDLTASSINLGSAADLAAAQAAGKLPVGFNLTQDLFAALLAGDAAHNITAVKRLRLGAANAMNVYGAVNLDLSALDNLTLTTPAIYGAGVAGDSARLTLKDFTWNVTQRTASRNGDGSANYASALPGAVVAGGPGTGSGALTIQARSITLGHPAALAGGSSVTFDHLLLGFSNVTLAASDRISTVGKTTLSLWQSGPDPSTAFAPKTYAGTGGNLTLSTPLLTTDAGGVASIRAGGNLSLTLPSGATLADTSTVSALGGRIDLISGGALTLDTAIALPSGRLTATASGDISLTGNSRIDLSGRSIPFVDVTKYSWGGDAVLESTHGNITQATGGIIDVSASNNDAGSVSLTATDAAAGRVILAGTLKGAGGTAHKGGSIDLRAQAIGNPANLSADFAALNSVLTTAGFSESRSFDLKQGDLTIGNELKAHNIAVSLDGGALTVAGTVDASGAAPGSISLAAQGDLTLASTAVLDAHGTVLQVDGYGLAVEAKNRGHIELGSKSGTLRLNSGATLDLSTPSGTYGQVVLNAPRTGETSGDIKIDATGPLTIRGANSIALNAVWTYTLPGGSTISQATLNSYDTASTGFINAAYNGGALTGGLQAKLAGLTTYGSAFHLRPGVEIDSTGNLTTSGDIDLSGYRYGSNANRDTTSATYGAGEPMALTIRAAGNLTLGGSLSDGFKGVPAIPGTPGIYGYLNPVSVATFDTFDCRVSECGFNAALYVLPQPLFITENWTIPNNDVYRGLVKLIGPVTSTTGGSYLPGQTVPAGTRLSANTYFQKEGSDLLPGFAMGRQVISPGTPDIPASPATSLKATMQAPGTMSASLRFVSGADLAAAASRVLQVASTLGASGNLVLNNTQSSAIVPSTLRTGTGNLELLAGGSINENSLYGVYTSGSDTGATGLVAGTYMPDHGGDLTLIAQGDITGYSYNDQQNNRQFWSPANWLVRSGDASTNATWSINFGGTVTPRNGQPYLRGFTGFGTLGGGNVTLLAGGNAGTLTRTYDGNSGAQIYSALQVAVGASGRVLSVNKDGAIVTGGTLAEAGGGNLAVKIGGVLNSGNNYVDAGADDGSLSLFTNLRGDTSISAGSIGLIAQSYGTAETGDPRGLNAVTPNLASAWGGIALTPGDGRVSVRTAGDLVVGTYADAGQTGSDISTSAFALWRWDTTSVSLFSAGGNLAPVTGAGLGNKNWTSKGGSSYVVAPPHLSAVAAQGSLYLGGPYGYTLQLAPSPSGQLQLLAGQSIYGAGLTVGAGTTSVSTRIDVSGANTGVNDIPNPFRPTALDSNGRSYNYASFQDDSVTTNLHAADHDPIRIYAAKGDIVNLAFGEVKNGVYYDDNFHTLYLAAKPARIIAGVDVVNLGAGSDGSTAGLILNNNPTDVSIIRAGRNIYYTNMQVAGPGSLDVTAGGTIYQADKGNIVSIGPLALGDARPGASIALTAGAGADGPDYAALAKLYLDPANRAVAGTPLADQPGKVAKTYQDELKAWLLDRYGYAAKDNADARSYFAGLAPEQKGIFLRQVYFAELKAAGREYNDPTHSRHLSYLRGRVAIATLFPAGQSYAGDIVMFGGSGVSTLFGGDIAMLTPGGKQVFGVEGQVPPSTAGIVTQGSGNIDLYSRGSILLGLSRIMTTYGGDILAWSATGDINAGRGAKTTVVYTPPKRVYDIYGNVTLSPVVPSSGAGIATLNPIPQVKAGDIDLIAPLGTIDAGEAGIRVSGNVNLAALQIVNAANIQVQGASAGLPTVQGPPTAALTTASNIAGAATPTTAGPAQNNDRPSIILVEFLGFGGGDGSSQPAPSTRPERPKDDQDKQGYDPNSAFRAVGNGRLTEQQRNQLTKRERQKLDQLMNQMEVH